jgi:phosphoribosyl 1,2-cyclic phosphodiesterase
VPVKVHLCGVRGSTPVSGREFDRYGGHTACVAVCQDEEEPRLILDAGTGLARAIPLFEGAPLRGTILLGHLHWDHTQGLPFFPPADNPDSRVRVVAPAQGDIERVLARMMSPPHFPIRPGQLRGEWSFEGIEPGVREVEGFEVRAVEVPHGGGRMMGYRISDGRATLAYVSDHGPIDAGPGPEGYGEYHDAVMELARDADLLVHDAQYTVEEFGPKAHFGHSTVDYAVRLGIRAGARRLVLFHHDPFRDDTQVDGIVKHCRELASPADIEIEAAVEGSVIEVGRDAGEARLAPTFGTIGTPA